MTTRITDPSTDPQLVYPEVPGINFDDFRLDITNAMATEQFESAMAQLNQYVATQQGNFLGYQANQKMDYSEDLSQFLNCQLNNIGDPFVSGNFTMNVKWVERAVMDYFASLWNARWPHVSTDPESYWGYVLSMGSTEANIFAMWNARDYLAGRKLLNDPENEERARKASLSGRPATAEPRLIWYKAVAPEDDPNRYSPVSFYSQDTHYSVIKLMRILDLPTFNELGSGVFACPLVFPDDYPEGFSPQYIDENGWPYEVPSNEDGSIYIPALAKLVNAFAELGHPIAINFNYGTTFKGALDDVGEAVNALVPILKEHGLYEREVVYDEDAGLSDIRTGYWFHVDGALSAAYAPFATQTLPVFDFSIPEVQSISMSGHKFIGAPWPCGIYMSKVKYQLLPPDSPNYLGSPDSTLAGSRNGFSSMILWDYIAKSSFDDSQTKISNAIFLANWFTAALTQVGLDIGQDLWVEVTQDAITVRFKKVNPDLIFKYSLSGEVLYVNGERREYNHLFVMEHVDQALLNELLNDLRQPGAFPDQDTTSANTFTPSPNPKNVKRGVSVPLSGRGFK